MFNDNEKEAVKLLTRTKGWEAMQRLFVEEANSIRFVKTDGKDYQTIAVEAIASEKFIKLVENFLKTISTISNEPDRKPASFYSKK